MELENIEDKPFEDLFKGHSTHIWSLLLANPSNTYTKKDIAELIGVTEKTVRPIIDKFIEFGIVEIDRKIANAKLVKLKKNNPLVKQMDKFTLELAKIVGAMALQEVSKEETEVSVDKKETLPMET